MGIVVELRRERGRVERLRLELKQTKERVRQLELDASKGDVFEKEHRELELRLDDYQKKLAYKGAELESVKEEVDSTHNLLLSREMLDKVCVLSGLEEVCIEENGILVRVERSECVDISIRNFRISVKACAQERSMPVLLVIIPRFVRYMLLFFGVEWLRIWPWRTLWSYEY